jgi:hypothetical protein
MTRTIYIITLISISTASALILSLPDLISDFQGSVYFFAIISILTITISRLDNIGYKKSTQIALLGLIPIANIAINIMAMSYPERYAETKTLDAPGKIIATAVIACWILIISLMIYLAID